MEPSRQDCAIAAEHSATGVRAAASGQGASIPAWRDRRMQLRAYNCWASMLDRRRFPTVADLASGTLGEIAPHSVLLECTSGCDTPAIAYLGEGLARECGAGSGALQQLGEAHEGSLLGRVVGHYREVLANRAPTCFEAEFAGRRGATVLYRGILLPFSADDATIDYVLAVINWKELRAGETAREPVEGGERPHGCGRTQSYTALLTDWADGPGCELDDVIGPISAGEMGECPSGPVTEVARGAADEYAETPGEAGQPGLPPALAERLRALPLQPLATLPAAGAEFALAMIRRPGDGTAALIGEVPCDPALITEAAQWLAR